MNLDVSVVIDEAQLAKLSSLWSTSNIHSHIIGHRTLDDIEVCQQSGGRSGSADADGPALFRNDPPRSEGSGEKLSKLQLGKQNSESFSLLVELARAENPPGSCRGAGDLSTKTLIGNVFEI